MKRQQDFLRASTLPTIVLGIQDVVLALRKLKCVLGINTRYTAINVELIYKWTKDLNGHSLEKEIQMAN